MFIIYFIQAFIVSKVLKWMIIAGILYAVVRISLWLFNYIKVSYVMHNLDKIREIKLKKQGRDYDTVYEETGYSINSRYYTNHYKARKVPKPFVYKGEAYFKDGRIIYFKIKETSQAYNELITKYLK